MSLSWNRKPGRRANEFVVRLRAEEQSKHESEETGDA